MPGWESDKQLHSGYQSSKPDRPGCTEEQRTEIERFRAELLRLSEIVATHPFWADVDQGDVVRGRRTLKHTHETALTEA